MTHAQSARQRGKKPQWMGKLAKGGNLVMRWRGADVTALEAAQDEAGGSVGGVRRGGRS